jgi:hypothetical protein
VSIWLTLSENNVRYLLDAQKAVKLFFGQGVVQVYGYERFWKPGATTNHQPLPIECS